MKRFWKEAAAISVEGGWAIALDGKPVHTPGRIPLVVPTEQLAQAIAAEWNSLDGAIDPRAMPLTGVANAAVERVAADPESFASGLAQYAQSDLLCYRADRPAELVRRQDERWDPLLAWARRRFDVDFRTTVGIVHVEQPQGTVARLAAAVGALDPFQLAGLSPLVTIGGSLIAGLAVLDKAIAPEAAWDAVTIDERWQQEQWGADAEAEATLEARRGDFLAGAEFLALLG